MSPFFLPLQRITPIVTAHRAALEIYTRAELPQQWAMTQNNLGNALQEQGIRTEKKTARRLFAEAMEAYRKALEVFTAPGLSAYAERVERNLEKLQNLIVGSP